MEETGSAPHRILVVANETIDGRALHEELAKRLEGSSVQVQVVVPALTNSPLKHGLGDVDEAREEAEVRLRASLEAMRKTGIEADGQVGDSDPLLAIDDALAMFPADEVIISTHPPETSRWLEKGIVDRAREEVPIPITHVVVDRAREDREVVSVETVEPEPEDERQGPSPELPAMAPRDVAVVVVGIAGTIALGILALTCSEGDPGTLEGNCAARMLIAIGAFLVTTFHVIGAVLFGTLRYRGLAEKASTVIILGGMPLAILVSLFLNE
jgi:hypothetical protein